MGHTPKPERLKAFPEQEMVANPLQAAASESLARHLLSGLRAFMF